MKRFYLILISLALPLMTHGATEDELIAVLKSDKSPHEKDVACAELKQIGTAKSVPALAALLTNDDLSHLARYALESMPFPEAGEALLAALNSTSGSNEVGIINSLAVRRDEHAASRLAELLRAPDTLVAVAAAEALGHIANDKAIKTLQAALPNAAEPLRAAEIDSLLACANKVLTSGKNARAAKMFQTIFDHETNADVKMAAFRGVLLASGPKRVQLLGRSVTGGDPIRQGAALWVAGEIKEPGMTEALADALPKIKAPAQIALCQCLAQRGDPAAAAVIAELVDSPDANVRIAAITALGDLGDGSDALLLAKHAAKGTSAERAAARQSLTDLHHGNVTADMIEAIPKASPEGSAELIRALGQRGDGSAAQPLLALARRSEDPIRSSALQALALIGGSEQIPALLEVVVGAANDDVRAEAADALRAICQSHAADAQPVLDSMAKASVEARMALLPVCSSLGTDASRAALRSAMTDSDPRVQEAAVRALCKTPDGQLLPDLVALACGNGEKKFRVLAVRGCVRLATQEEGVKLSDDAKLDALKKISATDLDTPEKRLVLSGLSTLADVQALALATSLLEDDAVRPEAAQAVIHISTAISGREPSEARAALKKVLAMSITSPTRKSAEKALKNIQ